MTKDTVVQRGCPEIGVVVRDVEVSTPFYRDGLALVHIQDVIGPRGLQRRFACGTAVIKLLQTDTAPSTTNPPGGMDGGATGLRWITIPVDDLDATVARCVALGAKVLAPITEYRPGHRAAGIEDPDGVFVEVLPRDEPWPRLTDSRL
jgi:catechol 2,3-dioxygenase-like lactoylglutathione lyase family enzyme